MTIIPRGKLFGVKTWDRGQGKYRWLGSFPTLAEAQAAEQNAKLPDVPTVKQWATIWLSDYPRRAQATQRTYRYAAKQIVKDLGARKLDDLGRLEARQIASRWPRGTTRVARTMWGDAKRDEICEHNPWTDLRLETPRGRKDITALTEGQIVELADIALSVHGEWGLEAKAIVLTLGYTGIRPGEMFSLKREDADLAGETLRVLHSGQGDKAPKNYKERVVALPHPAAQAIKAMPLQINDERLFHTKRGQPLTKSNFAYAWRSISAVWEDRTGDFLAPYALRHACATMLIERGLSPGDVAFQLGHQDGGRLVMALYGHPAEQRMLDRIKMAHGVRHDSPRQGAVG